MHKETLVLTNGKRIPVLALGTWLIDGNQVKEVVNNALQIGYRHIDTAQAYANERGVGEAIRMSGIPREEIFVTSKIAAEHKTYESASQSIDQTLRIMGLEYIDMMIIHSPQPWKIVNQSSDRYIEGNQLAWRALEDAYKAGKVHAIGVSNFLKEDIEYLLEAAEIKPMVNQVLCHVSNSPFELIEYCQAKGILIEAYSPVGHGAILENEEIAHIAKKYNVSIPQLCIRYNFQLGCIVLPKTTKLEHMKMNADFNFVISEKDMEQLKNLEKIKDYGEHRCFPVFGGKL